MPLVASQSVQQARRRVIDIMDLTHVAQSCVRQHFARRQMIAAHYRRDCLKRQIFKPITNGEAGELCRQPLSPRLRCKTVAGIINLHVRIAAQAQPAKTDGLIGRGG